MAEVAPVQVGRPEGFPAGQPVPRRHDGNQRFAVDGGDGRCANIRFIETLEDFVELPGAFEGA